MGSAVSPLIKRLAQACPVVYSLLPLYYELAAHLRIHLGVHLEVTTYWLNGSFSVLQNLQSIFERR